MDDDVAPTGEFRWRHDASTSSGVRALWALGIGSLLGAVLLIACSRIYIHLVELGYLRGATPIDYVVIGVVVAAVVLVVLAIAWPVVVDPAREGRISHLLRVADASETDVRRRVDAAAGTFVMAGVTLAAAVGVGGNVGHAVAAGVLSFGVVALVVSSVLASVGRLDAEERVLTLADPEQHVDLDGVVDANVRRLGPVALVTFAYDPRGVYEGRLPPQRLVLPADVAEGVASIVRGEPVQRA